MQCKGKKSIKKQSDSPLVGVSFGLDGVCFIVRTLVGAFALGAPFLAVWFGP